MTAPEPLLYTQNLAIGYTRGRKAPIVVAEHIDVALHPGEFACLLGPNGAGKSTLMRTIAGMQKPLAGRVMLRQADVQHLSAAEMAKRLSVVLTERPNVGLLTGYALVALGRHPYTDWLGRLSPQDEAMVRWAVDAVGAGDIAAHPVAELSDGQRQKLMIARALAQEPEVMLLDEPTAFLDLPRRVEVMRLLRHLAHETGRAILISTHDLDLALRTANTLWLMSGGVVSRGTPEDLILEGAFEMAFQSEGVSFDVASGAFQVNEQHSGLVSVTGHGIPHIWTQRALEREGFAIVHNGTRPDAYVTVVEDEERPSWRLMIDGTETAHKTIGSLIDALGTAKSRKQQQESLMQRDKERSAQRRSRRGAAKRGLVLVNTGDGKGKTTASLGVILRMLGRKKKVALIQFLKHEGGQWGEIRALKALGLEAIKTGDGFTWTSKDLDETQARALHGWEIAQEKIASGDYDLVVLDEFTYLLHFGWLDVNEALDWLKINKPEKLNLLITGRNAPQALIDYADTVTEMTKIKHAFDAGIPARAGIEF